MKQTHPHLLVVAIGLPLAGCISSQTPQADAQVTKQFSGGPMPPDAQKKFQESMKKHQEHARQNAPESGNP